MIILRNRGEIEIDLIKTMGVNVKKSVHSLGIFGTGLKYAIAVLLREGIDFGLFIGENKYEFFTQDKTIKGEGFEKTFQFCKMRGPFDIVDLPFTTELGSQWETWQGYRELYLNCLGEDGEIIELGHDGTTTSPLKDGSVKGIAGHTVFYVDGIDPRGIFLVDMALPLLFTNDDIDIYQGESEWIFYRGVRAKLLNKPSLHTYNIKKECDLSEDRLLCYDFEVHRIISESVACMGESNKSLIKSVITAKSEHFESGLGMNSNIRSYIKPSESFKQTYYENQKEANSSVRDYMKSHDPKIPKTRAQIRSEMFLAIDNVCKGYGLEKNIIVSSDRNDYIEITGDLILEIEPHEHADQS